MTTSADQAGFPLCSLAGNWWTFIVRGVLALILAVLAALMPASALLGLTIIFGAFSLVDGVFSLIGAYRKIRAGEKWGWLAFNGVIGIATGIVVLVVPMVATFVLALFLWWMIAFWSSVSGIAQIFSAIRLRKEIKGEFWLGLGGVLSLALAAFVIWMLLTAPVETFLAMGWVLAFYAAMFGVAMLLLGFRLRRVAKADEKDASAQPAS